MFHFKLSPFHLLSLMNTKEGVMLNKALSTGGLSSTPPFLEVLQISKRYPLSKHHAIDAVENLSFSIGKGEFVTLIGPSGCGKSTTLRMIAGFIKPDTGTIFQEGKAITHLGPEDRNIPMVFQNYALFPHMNVFENIAYGLKARNLPPDAIEAMLRNRPNLIDHGDG